VYNHYSSSPGKIPLHIQSILKKSIEQETEKSTDISVKNICSAYKKMFISFFNYIEILTSQKLQFQHIYNTGLGFIVVNLNLAQAKVYFQRTIHNSNYSNKAKSLMNELINQTNKEDIQQLFKALEKLNELKIQDWISFYKTPWILVLLTQAYTKMLTNLWNSTPFDTNIAESA
ncbi:3526_t:CDS:2, partial [Dentiscutata heterogama]